MEEFQLHNKQMKAVCPLNRLTKYFAKYLSLDTDIFCAIY
ncbi:MAG: hypothetical protein JWR38_4755 [Mucilaginibacter sp.]|nr:hypothetical protein [Mucilaginibacter sp.]